jgi:hypothetical protein
MSTSNLAPHAPTKQRPARRRSATRPRSVTIASLLTALTAVGATWVAACASAPDAAAPESASQVSSALGGPVHPSCACSDSNLIPQVASLVANGDGSMTYSLCFPMPGNGDFMFRYGRVGDSYIPQVIQTNGPNSSILFETGVATGSMYSFQAQAKHDGDWQGWSAKSYVYDAFPGTSWLDTQQTPGPYPNAFAAGRKANVAAWASNTNFQSSPPTSHPAPTHPDVLTSNQALVPGQMLQSASAEFYLSLQGDGNLVLYRNTAKGPVALWSTITTGSSVGKAIMQSDGNFVLYDASGKPLWATGTVAANANAVFALQDDGNLVVYQSGTYLACVAKTDGGTYVGQTSVADFGNCHIAPTGLQGPEVVVSGGMLLQNGAKPLQWTA